MNKTILFGFAFILMLSSVFAGTVELTNTNNVTTTWNANKIVTIDADTLEGETVANIVDLANQYVKSNEAKYLTDSTGTSFNKVYNFLFGDFWDTLKEHFATKEKVAVLEARIERLEKILNTPISEEEITVTLALKQAKETGKVVYVNELKCYPYGECMRVVQK